MAAYLVTGAAGFIASRVAEFLLKDNHVVYGVDNLNHAYDVRMKQYRLNRLRDFSNFSFFQLDISDRGILDFEPLLEPDFSGVINLAARAGVRSSVENPWVYIDTNVTGTLNLLELCQRKDIPKFVLASTSSVYGSDAPLPTPETADSDHPLQSYAASKKGAEALTHAYHHLYGIDISIVRYFTVYGPAGRPDMVMFRFNKWIMEGTPLRLNGDGEQTRGFTYVDDIARGTIAALKPVGYQVYNLGGHEVISINQLIHFLEEAIGKPAEVEHFPAHPADMKANQADIQKAQKDLGWEPKITLEEGIRRMVEWYRQEREWAQDVQTGR